MRANLYSREPGPDAEFSMPVKMHNSFTKCRCHTEMEAMRAQVLQRIRKRSRYLSWRQKGADLEGISIEESPDGKASLADQDPVIVADASCRVAAGDGRAELGKPDDHCSELDVCS